MPSTNDRVRLLDARDPNQDGPEDRVIRHLGMAIENLACLLNAVIAAKRGDLCVDADFVHRYGGDAVVAMASAMPYLDVDFDDLLETSLTKAEYLKERRPSTGTAPFLNVPFS